MTHSNNDSNNDKGNPEIMPGMGGIFDGVASLIGKLGELAEKGEALQKHGKFKSASGKDAQASYGFSVKFGAGGERSDDIKVQPVATGGNANRSGANRTPQKPEDREPQVDVFSEQDHVLVVAEMPGIAVENIELDFNDENMTLVGKSDRVKFSKTIELPHTFTPDDVDISMNNGVVEIRLNLPAN